MALPLGSSLASARSPAAAVSVWVGWFWGLWIATFPIVDFLLRPSRGSMSAYSLEDARVAPPVLNAALVLLIGLGVLPAFAGVRWLRLDLRTSKWFAMISAAIVLMVVLSTFQIGSWNILLNAFTLIFVLALATVFAAQRSDEALMDGFFCALTLGLTAILLLMIADGNYSYGRLMGRSGPNYWGTTAATLLFALLAVKRPWLKLACAVVAVAALVLCQSRGSMICSTFGLLMVLAVWVANRPGHRLSYVALGALLSLPAIVLGSSFVLERVLLIDNARRGLGSNGSGRAGAWAEAFNLAATHPWVGVGFRQSDNLIVTASSAHNAYLATAAEIGFPGLAFYVLLLVGGAVVAGDKALRRPGRTRLAVMGILLAYTAIGFLERRGLNVGNAHSLAMIFCAAWAWRSEPRVSSDAGRQRSLRGLAGADHSPA